MPDVGVLELKIESDASKAAGGLTKLANGLEKAGKNAASFSLGNVKQQITEIVDAVKNNNTTVKNLGTLINAIAGFKKVEKIKFDAEPFEKLKKALGDGISLGQAGTQLKQLREALDGEWNTGNAVLAGEALKAIGEGAKAMTGTNLGTKATQISKLSGALAELADSCKKLQDVKDTVSGTSKTGGDLGISGVNEQGERVSYKMGLQFFAGRKSGGGISASNAAGDWRNSMNGVLESAKSAPKAGNSLNELAAVIKELNALMGGNYLREYADGLKQINEAINSGAKSYLTLGRLATSVTKVKEAMQGFKIPSFGKLIELAQALQENYNAENNLNKLAEAMSAMKAASDGFKTPSAKGVAKIVDAVNGAGTSNKGPGITTTEAVEQLKEDLPEVSGLFENVAEQTQRIEETISDTVKQVESGIRITGNLSAEFLKMHQELVEKYKANPAMTLEDYYFGRRPGGSNGKRELMSEWLHGQGTKGEQKYALEEMGRQFNMSVDEVKKAIGEIEERYRAAAEAAREFADAAQQVNEIIQMTGMGGGYASAFGQMFSMWNIARMSQSLGPGTGGPAGYIGDAIEAEGSVSDVEPTGLIQVAQVTADVIEKTSRLRELYEQVISKLREIGSMRTSFSDLKKGIEKTFPSLTGLIKRFISIAKMRALRFVIKQITAGVSEGVENMYWYSKAINSSFAPAMDSAATSLQQMKNSIGSALAPLLESLIPTLQTVVNWFITGINYINQFFALLNGQSTWTRALPVTTSAFEKQEKATKKASNAIKDLLADWDELNIIQSESTSGTGSSTQAATDYLSMFEEVGTFENKIKKIVNFIKDNFDEIKSIAAAIGATMLAWKISTGFAEVLPLLSKIATGVALLGTVAITIGLTGLTGAQFAKTGEAGWFIADALTGAIGSGLAWQFAKKLAGTNAAQITAGITLTLSGLVNIQQALSAVAQAQLARWGMLTILGSVETGIGAALIAKGFGVATALAFGFGALAATATVAISLGAMIELSKDQVEWGSITLTKEDVEAYVRNNMFTGLDITATIDLIDATIESVTVDKNKIRNQVAVMLPTINAIRLGVNKAESYKKLKDQIFGNAGDGTEGVISMIQTYAKDNIQELETSFAIIPVINEKGQDVSADLLKSGITGWTQVNEYMEGLGKQLGEELSKGFTEDGLAKFDEKAVKAITDKMVKISQIITGSQVETAAQANLAIGLDNMGLEDLTYDSVKEVIGLFNDYRGELEKEYTTIYTDAANQYLTLSRFYAETGNSELANIYKQQYDYLMAMLPKSVSAAVNKASAPGLDMVYDFLNDKFSDAFYKLESNLKDSGDGIMRQFLFANFIPTNGDVQKTADALNAVLVQFLSGENSFLAGILTQMPGVNVWGALSEEARKNLLEAVKGLYGQDVADTIQQAFAPTIDDTSFNSALYQMELNAKAAAEYIQTALSMFGGNWSGVTSLLPTLPTFKVAQKAAGGFVRSGDLVMANENGNFEMMGKMGNQPVVANNQQIVNGITQGVATANGGVESRLSTIENLLTRLYNKEFVAKAVPSSTWGRNNAVSSAAYDKVTGG